MEKKMNVYDVFDRFVANKRLVWAFISSLIMVMAAYGYAFFNATFIGDRILYFGEPSYGTEIAGKWFAQYYSALKYYAYLPWFIGILSIIYVTISLYIVIEMLRIEKKVSILMIAGLYSINISTVTASFYGLDDFMFALMMASLSAGVWLLGEREYSEGLFRHLHNHILVRMLISALFISIVSAEYGAYTSVAPTLVILSLFTMLFKGKDYKYILRRGVEYIVTFGIGVALYYVILRMFLNIRNLEMQSYMGEDRLVSGASFGEVLSFIKLAYTETIGFWTGNYSSGVMPHRIVVEIFVMAIILFIVRLFQEKDNLRSIYSGILLMFLVGVFPLSSGLICVMAFGNVHYLMIFTYALFYVGIVKMIEGVILKGDDLRIVKIGGVITAVLIIVFIYNGILVCNMAQTSLEKAYTTSQSIATRIMERIESCADAEGTETILMVGDVADSDYFRLQGEQPWWRTKVYGLGVAGSTHSFTYDWMTKIILDNIMGFNRKIEYYSEPEYQGYNMIISEMPCYPADGCIRKQENFIIIKFKELNDL